MRSCNACQSTNLNYVLSWGPKYKIFKCSNCGLILSDPLPSEEELDKFYQGFLYDKPTDKDFRKIIEKRKKELKKYFSLKEKKLFLDFGGGTGSAFIAAKELGMEAYLFEVDELAINFILTKFDIEKELLISNIKDLDSGKFDYVFVDNVVEHVPDPKEFINKVTSLLKPGGQAIFKTPRASNRDSFFNLGVLYGNYFKRSLRYNSLNHSLKAMRTGFWHCDPPRHLYSFSNESIFEIFKNIDNANDLKIDSYDISITKHSLVRRLFSRPKTLSGTLRRLAFLVLVPIELIIKVFQIIARKLGISKGGLIFSYFREK